MFFGIGFSVCLFSTEISINTFWVISQKRIVGSNFFFDSILDDNNFVGVLNGRESMSNYYDGDSTAFSSVSVDSILNEFFIDLV